MANPRPTPSSANWRPYLIDTLGVHLPQNAQDGDAGSGITRRSLEIIRRISQYGANPAPYNAMPLDGRPESLPSIWLGQHSVLFTQTIPQAVRESPLRDIIDTAALVGANEGVLLNGTHLTNLPSQNGPGAPFGVADAWWLVRESETFHKVFREGLYMSANTWGAAVPADLSLNDRWERITTNPAKQRALLFYLRTLLQRYPVQYVQPAIDAPSHPRAVAARLPAASAPIPQAAPTRGVSAFVAFKEDNTAAGLWTQQFSQRFTPARIAILNARYATGGAPAFNNEVRTWAGPPNQSAFAMAAGDITDNIPVVAVWRPLGDNFQQANIIVDAPDDDEDDEENEPIVRINPGAVAAPAPALQAPPQAQAGTALMIPLPFIGGGGNGQNRFVCRVTNPTRTLFSFIPVVRPQLTGFWAGLAWSVKTPAEGIRVQHDTRLIRRRILSGMVYNPGASHQNPTGATWVQLAKAVYNQVRSNSLFAPNDGRKNYYASIAFFFEGLPDSSFGLANERPVNPLPSTPPPNRRGARDDRPTSRVSRRAREAIMQDLADIVGNDPFELDDIESPEDVRRRQFQNDVEFLSTPLRVPWCPERAVGTAYSAADPYAYLFDFMETYINRALTSGGGSALLAMNKYRLYIEVQWINDKRANRTANLANLALEGSVFATAVQAGIGRADLGDSTIVTRRRRAPVIPPQPAAPPRIQPPRPYRAPALPAPQPPAPEPPARRRRVAVPVPPSTRVLRSQTHAQARVGAYVANSHQEKMFVRGSLSERFSQERCLFMTPQGTRNTCAAMSLFRAERTIYLCDTNGSIVEIRKGPHEWAWCEDEILIPVIDEERWANVQSVQPYRRSVSDQEFLRLSHSEKHVNPEYDPEKKGGGPFMPGVLSEEEFTIWEYATEEMLATMEFQLNRPVDVNDLEDMCQSFADCFSVVVGVYDSELRGQRIDVYTPEKLTPSELVTRDGKLMVVNIFHDQGHCHAITHHQSFISGRNRQKCQRPYQYCPICDKSVMKELNTLDAAKKHITKCIRTHTLCETYQAKILEKNFQGSIEVVKKIYKRVNGRMISSMVCATCKAEITQEDYMGHVCRLPTKERKPLEDKDFYVYDMESAQVMTDQAGVQTHVCNCVCMRKVYAQTPEEERGRSFSDEVEFMEALKDPQGPYKNAVFIAHNGGGYDSLFLLRVIERWELPHHCVPSPSSDHKFLSIHLQEQNITFLDSMRFIPGSLRGIAESFGCSVSKGDFPHRFNDGKSLDYEGPIPPHDEENDYWCQKSARNEKHQREWVEWYAGQCEKYCTCWGLDTCTCGKEVWKMREVLFDYCMLDVHVLAEVVRLYREETLGLEIGERLPDSEIDWRPPIIDPFTYMTLAQITINTLALGFQDSGDLLVTLHQRARGGQNPRAIYWLQKLQEGQPEHKIYHRGNHHREYYAFHANCFVDGICFETETIYLYLDCEYWGCKCCYPEEHMENKWNDFRHMTYVEMERHYDVMMQQLAESHKNVVILWGHDFSLLFPPQTILSDDKTTAHLLNYQDCFYGGRTEAFALYADARVLGKKIKYFDVCSLYPSTYLLTLPTGVPTQLLGEQIDRTRLLSFSEFRYFGFIRCRVLTNPDDKIGLLPVRDVANGRLTFPVGGYLEGCWHTEELYLAMEHGYTIESVFEAYIWETTERSDQHLRGYVAYFLRMKQEAEGWKKLGATSETPTEDEQEALVESLYLSNGRVGRIRPEHVRKDPVKRQLAKLYLNALWGKFAQKEATSQSMTVYGPAQFSEVWSMPQLIKESFRFRETSPGVFKVHYKIDEAFSRHVGHGNILFAATVTAHARCVLHRKIMEIGYDNVLYCDTDSVIFLDNPQEPMIPGFGLGEWTDEYPGQEIVRFAAMAPKMYMLEVEGCEAHKVRAKGVQLSLRNQRKLQIDCVMPLLDRIGRGDIPTDPIQLENMIISTNSRDAQFEYGTMMTRTGEKQARVVLSKREVVTDTAFTFESHGVIRTLPLKGVSY